MITMTDMGLEERLITLSAKRMGVSPRLLSHEYDSSHGPSNIPTWWVHTASGGTATTMDASGAPAHRQAITAASNSSLVTLHKAHLGRWADSATWYHFHRFRVGAPYTLGGAAAPVSGTIMCTGFNSNTNLTGDGVLFGIFGTGSLTNWVIAKQASSVFTYQDTGIAHDITASTPAAHEIHMWRDIDGNHWFQFDDGAVTAISPAGIPTTAAASRLEMWGAQNASAGDANSRAFKSAIVYYATVRT